MWDFSRGPVGIECELGILEERVGVLDLFEECLFRPSGVFSHSISIDLGYRDHSAWNLSIDNFIPNSGFGEGDGWVSWCQSIQDGFGGFCDICVLGIVAESDSEVVFLCPSSQDCFDIVVLGAYYIDFVGDNMGGCLDSFPGSISTESESVDLPVLESRLLGSRIDGSSGFGGLMYRLVLGQNVWIVRRERS